MNLFNGLKNRAVAWTVLFALVGLATGSAARCDEVFTFIVKKQEEKKKKSWSLAEWLETRDRMRLMDLWLALHSPSPYEFFLGADFRNGSQESGPKFSGWGIQAAGYASIFGVEAQREALDELVRYHGLFNFRVFGFHAQGTNITLQAGIRSETSPGVDAYRNALAGAAMTLNLTRFFGLTGLYRHYFDSTAAAGGSRVSGNRYEGGAFIDFDYLRLHGAYFSEPQTVELSGLSTDTHRSGFYIGTRLFF